MKSNPTTAVQILQAPFWLMRLALHPSMRKQFTSNPYLVAAWYSCIGALLKFPTEAEGGGDESARIKPTASQLAELAKFLPAASMDGAALNRFHTGMHCVLPWIQANTPDFFLLVEASLKEYTETYGNLDVAHLDNFSVRVQELADVLDLSALECNLFAFGVATTVSIELRVILEQLEQTNRLNPELFAGLFNATPSELAQALAPTSTLRISGLLQGAGPGSRFPSVSEFWVQLLARAPDGLFASLVEPAHAHPSASVPARLLPEDYDMATATLNNATGPGVNLLFYGPGGLDKQSLVLELVRRSVRPTFVMSKLECGSRDLAAAVYVAQRSLASKMSRATLVVDGPEILEGSPLSSFGRLVGSSSGLHHGSMRAEHFLSTNPLPTVWLSSDVRRLDHDTVARFVCHAPWQKATKEERRQLLEAQVQGLGLSEGTREELLKLENLSSVQLTAGLHAASLSGHQEAADRERALVQALTRSLRAMDLLKPVVAKECVTEYSLEFINCAGRFSPAQILKALERNPKASICLSGLPGTGKTQFAEHVAQKLGRPLVAKRASDLVSKWSGETEKNLAAMFDEATSEEAVLFLDEADSFLSDRRFAHASWETARVNELLQLIERFEGVFIVSTNLFESLDAAALRRFTFKLQFRSLTADQRWNMFVNETGLRGWDDASVAEVRQAHFDNLARLQDLCAGDFATVKRQCLLLGEELTPGQWFEQLELECQAKLAGNPAYRLNQAA